MTHEQNQLSCAVTNINFVEMSDSVASAVNGVVRPGLGEGLAAARALPHRGVHRARISWISSCGRASRRGVCT